VVGIATRYALDDMGFSPLVVARFTVPLQNGPGFHPASRNWIPVFLAWSRQPGRGVNHPPPSSAGVKERVETYLPLLAFTTFYREKSCEQPK